MTDDLNARIEARLAARQNFFTLVESVRRLQTYFREKGKATKSERDQLDRMLQTLDDILSRAAGVMLSQNIIIPSPPSQFNGGETNAYLKFPVRFDYSRGPSELPPLMEFTFAVLMMRKWQLIARYSRNTTKAYTNLFGWQDEVDKHLKKGWIWDQTNSIREYQKLYKLCHSKDSR